MCGRFTLIRLSDFTDMFPWIRPPQQQPPPSPRYNIAPTQPIAAVRNNPEPQIEFLNWGLIPSWAKDPAIGNRMINARAESMDKKPAFRTALRRRRCVIPASGFFEWKKLGRQRVPMYVTAASARPLGLAGLWDVWHDDAGSQVTSCTIITVPSNELVRPIHDRMPAILRESDYRLWLDPAEQPPEKLLPALGPYPAGEMRMQEVSRAANNAKIDSPQCIEPASAPAGKKPQQGVLF